MKRKSKNIIRLGFLPFAGLTFLIGNQFMDSGPPLKLRIATGDPSGVYLRKKKISNSIDFIVSGLLIAFFLRSYQ